MNDPVNRPEGPVRVSVIVPARNCPGQLRYCLDQLAASTEQGFELIVADDASTDDTAAVAESYGAKVIRLEKQAGPAGARNRGAEIATGDILYFVDADTGVHPHDIGAVVEAFDQDAGLSALFGSYDTKPTEPNFISQYRNLFHHFVHQEGQEEASTFWSGCGAMRKDVFLGHGGFDPGLYNRPAIEDIELGARLVKAGQRIAVKKHIQVTHLKRWTLWGTIRTDVFDRGIPWTRLILREGAMPDDLNTGVAQRVSLMLTALLLLTFVVGAWFQPWLCVLPVAGWLAIVGLDRWTLSHRMSTAGGWLVALATLAGLGWAAASAPWWAAASALWVAGIVGLNRRLYGFYARERGTLFAAAVVPMHILYFLYSGVAFGCGVLLHLRDRFTGGTAEQQS